MEANEDNVPDAEAAQKLVKEFETVTDTDEIMAQYYLQEHNWDIMKAVNTYFAAINEKAEEELAQQAAEKAAEEERLANARKKTVSEGLEEGILTTKPPEKLVMMSWNIDGLDGHNLKKRTKAVCMIIEQEAADIVFLQEVIAETFSYIESKLTGYKCLAAKNDEYFVATLLRNGRVYLDSSKVIDFPNSLMFRHALITEAHCGSVKLHLINSHLESTKEHARERMNQLKICFEEMNKVPSDRAVIFGGDLNMRDQELASVGGIPLRVLDVWQKCGSRKEAEYTWDMQRNSNLQGDFGKFRPKCRFDRIYYRNSNPVSIDAEHFGLVGLQKITGTQSFPSDHWGLRTLLKLVQQPVDTKPAIKK